MILQTHKRTKKNKKLKVKLNVGVIGTYVLHENLFRSKHKLVLVSFRG